MKRKVPDEWRRRAVSATSTCPEGRRDGGKFSLHLERGRRGEPVLAHTRRGPRPQEEGLSARLNQSITEGVVPLCTCLYHVRDVAPMLFRIALAKTSRKSGTQVSSPPGSQPLVSVDANRRTAACAARSSTQSNRSISGGAWRGVALFA